MDEIIANLIMIFGAMVLLFVAHHLYTHETLDIPQREEVAVKIPESDSLLLNHLKNLLLDENQPWVFSEDPYNPILKYSLSHPTGIEFTNQRSLSGGYFTLCSENSEIELTMEEQSFIGSYLTKRIKLESAKVEEASELIRKNKDLELREELLHKIKTTTDVSKQVIRNKMKQSFG